MSKQEVKLTAEQRSAVIVTAGLKIVKEKGLGAVTFASIGDHTKIQTSMSTVKYHFKTRDDLWNAIIAADKTGKAKKDAESMGWS